MGEWDKGDYEYPYAKDGVNWDAASHQQLWDWFSEPRLQEMEAWVDSLTHKVAAHFQAAADKVDQALRAAGVHWEGSAADACRTPPRRWLSTLSWPRTPPPRRGSPP